MKLKGKHILVMGLGKSGVAVAEFARRQGAAVTATDAADAGTLKGTADRLQSQGIELVLGHHPESVFAGADLVVVSPGVPHTLAVLRSARRRGIPVVGEMELAARFLAPPLVAVTGTNGKTTTTTLLGRMLAESGQQVFVGGNIGDPLIGFVDRKERADTVVAEVSSFQLDTTRQFRPRIGVLLNISQDHLDRYDNYQAYAASKARLFMNQTPTDVAIYNGADPMVRDLVRSLPSRKWPFFPAGLVRPPGDVPGDVPGAWIHEDAIRFRTDTGITGDIDLSRTPLSGGHNMENIAAAALAALAAGATVAGIQTAVDRFSGLAHRLETVAVIDQVTYVDDSKATNVDAVARALEAFTAPVVLIMGGRDKEGDYAVLSGPLSRRVKHLILMGEAADRIEKVLGGQAPTESVAGMAEAVTRARARAAAGDVVLLSPACSSFDMYDNYAERGEDFSARVQDLR